MNEVVLPDETLDILFNEKIKILQKKEGYRFSIDAILLANFIVLKKNERLLDIGTGCGIIPIYMTRKGYTNEMVGIEIQKDLFQLALRNKRLNRCDNIRFIHGDIKTSVHNLKIQSPYHVIVSNPPYTKKDAGRISPILSRSIARYESLLTIDELLNVSASLLNKKGRLYTIYPSRRLGEVIHLAKTKKMEPKRLRFIYPKKGDEANLFLAEFIKEGGGEVNIEKPLVMHEKNLTTEEINTYLSL
jgi:tRNA1Val (adenine37-N6)-methyltransferase